MYRKIYKNHQINVGIPYQVRAPIDTHSIRQTLEEEDINEISLLQKDTGEEIINNARHEADTIIKEGELEALRIIKEAQKEAEENKKTIFEQAKKQGYEEGYNKAARQYKSLLDEANALKEQCKAEYNETLSAIEMDAVKLVIDIAEKVLNDQLNLDESYILSLVRQAIEKCSNREKIVLKVSEEDFDFIQANRDKLLSWVTGLGELEIKKDLSLSKGACIVETAYGNIDTGLKTKLEKIKEAFFNTLNS